MKKILVVLSLFVIGFISVASTPEEQAKLLEKYLQWKCGTAPEVMALFKNDPNKLPMDTMCLYNSQSGEQTRWGVVHKKEVQGKGEIHTLWLFINGVRANENQDLSIDQSASAAFICMGGCFTSGDATNCDHCVAGQACHSSSASSHNQN